MRYELNSPIEKGAEKYEALELEEPTMRAMRLHKVTIPNPESTDEFTIESMARMICACCTNIPPILLDELKPSDILGAYGVCTGFLA